MYQVLLAALLLAVPARGEGLDCPALLATSFGMSGPVIASVENDKQFVILRDGFAVGTPAPMGDNRVPRFRRVPKKTEPLFLPVQNFAALASEENHAPYLATVNTDGDVDLILPDGRRLAVVLPQGEKAVSVAFYRTPTPARGFVTTKGIVTRKTGMPENALAMEKLIEAESPVYLYVGTQERIWRGTFQKLGLIGEDPDIQKTLLSDGIASVDFNSFDRSFSLNDKKPSAGLVDFSSPFYEGRYLVPLAEENQTLMFSPFSSVFEFDDRIEIGQPDFLAVLSDGLFVVGSSLGQVSVIDRKKAESIAPIAFTSMAYLQSLSAHQSRDCLEVWAVNSLDHRVYRWASSDIARIFRPIQDFPTGVTPERVSTFSAPVPALWGPDGQSGYLANFRVAGNILQVEEFLVLGSDRLVYALRDRVNPDFSMTSEWVSFPFEQD